MDDETRPMTILETDRLEIRHFKLDDAPFIVALLNDPSFLRFIGDRGVRTREDARAYLQNGPIASYRLHGYGLFRTSLKAERTPIGMCGLLKRDYLDAPDIGFAFLPPYRAQGYAFEAAAAVIAHGRQQLGLTRIAAIVSPDNERSIRLLDKLGLHAVGRVRNGPDDDETMLFMSDG